MWKVKHWQKIYFIYGQGLFSLCSHGIMIKAGRGTWFQYIRASSTIEGMVATVWCQCRTKS